jgi:hypothetical protein
MFSYSPHRSNPEKTWLYAKDFKTAQSDIKGLIDLVQEHVWSPIVWKDGIRKEANFISADWCVLDFDDPEMTLAQALNVFCDRVHVIGTTKSHLKEKGGIICDRFRVCLKFSETITNLREYRWNIARYLDQYPVDKACKDGARFFYPCVDIISSLDSAEAYREDVDHKVPENFERPKDIKAAVKRLRSGIFSDVISDAILKPIPEGRRNAMCYRVSIDLTIAGYSEEDIIQILLKSPTYKSELAYIKEITATVRSGIKRAHSELEEIK